MTNLVYGTFLKKLENLLSNGFVLVSTEDGIDNWFHRFTLEKNTADFYVSVDLVAVTTDNYHAFIIRSFEYNYRNGKHKSSERHYTCRENGGLFKD